MFFVWFLVLILLSKPSAAHCKPQMVMFTKEQNATGFVGMGKDRTIASIYISPENKRSKSSDR